MSRQLKRTISMCATLVLIAVMAGLYLWQQNVERPEEDIPLNLPAITTLIQRPEREVASVTFHSGGEPYTMVPHTSENGIVTWHWGPAPEFLINTAQSREKVRLAWQFTASDIAHEDTAGLDLALFGLNPPQITLEAEYTDGTSSIIRVGSPTADMRNYFVMIDDDPTMYLLGSIWVTRITTTIEDMIDLRLPRFDVEAAELIKIDQRDTPTIELAVAYGIGLVDEEQALSALNLPEFKFLRMIQPMPGRGLDSSRLELFVIEPLNELRLLDVVSLAPANLAPYGLENPSLEFMYQDPFGEAHLIFGDTFVHEDILHIYVKFADRPHVFRARYTPASVLFDLNLFTFIERFHALVAITDVESITVTSSVNEARNLEMVVNHCDEEGSDDIFPVINGVNVRDSAFRVAYRLLIGLSADGETEPFTPQGTPEFTIVYHRIAHPDTELRFFAMDSNFYVVSINGEDAWGVTNRRDVETFFSHIETMLAAREELPGHLSRFAQ